MNNISRLRKEHKLSQKQLSKRLNIAQNTLSQYETGIRKPTQRIISDIAEIFGVSNAAVLGIDDDRLFVDSDLDISSVTKIVTFSSEDIEQINFYLRSGWLLLHIGSVVNSNSSDVIYSLGWRGSVEDAEKFILDEPGTERYTKIDANGYANKYGWEQ